MTPSEYQNLVDFLGRQFAEVDRRFEAMDQRFDVMDQRFEAVDRRFGVLDQRFEVLTTHVDGRLRELQADILGHFDELYRRLERLEAEYFAIVQTLRRIETLVADEQVQRRVLTESVTRLRADLTVLQARVDGLEERLRG